jgi:hypothetical protein
MMTAQIFNIQQSNPEVSSIKKMEEAYNEGMVSVLTDLANVKLTEHENANTVFQSEGTKEFSEELDRLHNTLMAKVENDPELVRLLVDYDTAACNWASTSTTDTFKQGFLEGYKYHQVKSGDIPIDIKKRPHSCN